MKKDLFDVVCVGHAVLDVLVRSITNDMLNKHGTLEKVMITTGGDACNEAITLAKLGANVAFAGTLGNDIAGKSIAASLRESGVNVDSVTFSGRISTTVSIVNIDDTNQHSLWSYMGGNNAIHAAMIDERVVLKSRVFCIGSVMPDIDMDFKSIAELLEMARSQGVVTAADAMLLQPIIGRKNAETMLDELSQILNQLDYFLPSGDEARGITGEKDPELAAKKLHEMGASNVVVKLGGEGCLISDGVETRIVPSFPVKVVDTVGAGDNFVAGFLFGLSKRWNMERCALLGNATAALSVMGTGAVTGVRSLAQVAEFIKEQGVELAL